VTNSTPQLDPALETVVRKQLAGDEKILCAWEYAPGEVKILLTNGEMRFAPKVGGGRALEFKLQDGQWVFHFAGRWIS
jgi:hypothetical protein